MLFLSEKKKSYRFLKFCNTDIVGTLLGMYMG